MEKKNVSERFSLLKDRTIHVLEIFMPILANLIEKPPLDDEPFFLNRHNAQCFPANIYFALLIL